MPSRQLSRTIIRSPCVAYKSNLVNVLHALSRSSKDLQGSWLFPWNFGAVHIILYVGVLEAVLLGMVPLLQVPMVHFDSVHLKGVRSCFYSFLLAFAGVDAAGLQLLRPAAMD